jgi:hypothetical protein
MRQRGACRGRLSPPGVRRNYKRTSHATAPCEDCDLARGLDPVATFRAALATGSLGEQPKQSNQKQQAWDCSEYGRSKCVPGPGRWWVFGAVTDAGVPFGVGHRGALLASIACSMPTPANTALTPRGCASPFPPPGRSLLPLQSRKASSLSSRHQKTRRAEKDNCASAGSRERRGRSWVGSP